MRKASMFHRHILTGCEPCGDAFEAGNDEGLCEIGDAMREDALAGIASRYRVPRRRMWYVNVYELDRHCGGREEGGWWYNSGTPLGVSEMVFTEAFAQFRARALSKEYPWSSNLYNVSYGRRGAMCYEVRVEPHPAKSWPEVTPHYE